MSNYAAWDVAYAHFLCQREGFAVRPRVYQGVYSALNRSLEPELLPCCRTFGMRVVVYNPLATPGRTQSDIAHEVAHLLLKHSVKTVETIGGVSFFTCDADEEQEANWLAACLLLPRPLLLHAAKRGMDCAAIAEAYKVSEAMAAFRLRTTGVERQLGTSRDRR